MDCRAHSILGNAYFREKKFKEASNEYERVIDLDPTNEKACENLAIAYAKQGELEKAIHHWERLLNISPNRMDVRLSIQRAKAFLEKY
jgi:cytochrome c-type biogenesis protein CcmH/NrfG